MKEVFPGYYDKFKCIADRCKHSCCIGWEIDIDEDTMEIYNSLDGEMGERIRNSIEGDVPHFVLGEGDRCPFLNENGLCDIIAEYGDGAISDICYLHPRFSHFYSGFTETGLGLCCEEAVRVALTEKEKFYIPTPDDVTEKEKEFFAARQKAFDMLQNREYCIGTRFSMLAKEYGFEFDFSLDKLRDFYMSLERLDEKWTDELLRLKDAGFDKSIFENEDFQIFFEQLGVYFVFRHFSYGDYALKIRFALLSCYIIGALCSGQDFEKAFDIVRMYSSEIEYSTENTENILNIKAL